MGTRGDRREKSESGGHAQTEDRRNFLKRLVVAASGVTALTVTGSGLAHSSVQGEMNLAPPTSELPWRRTIFCQFDGEENHKVLFEGLTKCAREIDCQIIRGTDGHPDIYAYGCFVQILDRTLVGDEMWREYAAAYKDAGDITPCFIIDDRKDLPLPSWKFAKQIDMQDPSAVNTIVETIRQMKTEMNLRLPDIFQEPKG